MTDFKLTRDGKGFSLKIVTEMGLESRLEFPCEELGTIVHFLVSQAAEMGQRARQDGATAKSDAKPFSPIPVEAVYTSSSDSHLETCLVVRLFGFDLAFRIPTTALPALADNIRHAATLMSSDHAKPQ
jgi:hypothetical protein